MSDRGWCDDSDYDAAVQRAERATRFGWAAIAGTTGVLGCALVAMTFVCVAVALACLYLVVAMDH